MDESQFVLISSVLVSAPMELLREFTGNYQCRNSGAEYLTIIATVLVQNACSKKIRKRTPRTLECGADRNQDPFSLFSARGILSELTGIYQCRNSGAEYLTVNATVLVQDVCSKKIRKSFQVLSMSTKRRKKLKIHTKIAAIGQVRGFRVFALEEVSRGFG